MRKMGTIESRERHDDVAQLEQKYPIIAKTLAKAMPVNIVEYFGQDDDLGEFEWQVKFDDNNQIPLDLLNGETADTETVETWYTQADKQNEIKEIRKLAGQYFAKRPRLKERFESVVAAMTA